ncbi:MAG: methyltransferase domain-containing protein, partial [Thiothrix sp.]|nr:methyltransferase domain-containing protein [Thiothrix sp.]
MSRRRKYRKPGAPNLPPAEARIESLTLDGRGVAHVEGKTVFIEGGIPGERVRFSYQSRKPNFDEGQVLEVLEPAPQRVEPRCPHYALCGACSWQHIALEAQIHYKQQVLLENLAHIGKVTPETVIAPLTADGWGYRRKARLGVRWVAKKGRALVGFRERSGHFLADLSRCEILHPSVGEALETLQALISGLDARQCIPQIEVAVGDNATALVLRHMEPLSDADTGKLLAFAEARGFQLYLQPQGPDSLQRLWPPTAALYYAHPDSGIRVDFEPLDFFQVNQPLNLKMVQQALELLQVGPEDRVLDLFCGLGNFTLPLARRAASVTGVEGDIAMVARARAAAQANGIGNTDYFACNLMDEAGLERQPWLRQPFDKILLDP